MAEFRVFYSWQSDLPNATNRGFIEKALQEAGKSIGGDTSVEVEPVIDRDTLGIAGTPDIAHAILEKIEGSDVFVCDVSIINEDTEQRRTPNPNVLIELGYAFKSLGPSRVILVMNTAFGKPELLPFDLRMKRVTRYDMRSQDNARSKERHRLSSELETALRTIITEQGKSRPKTIPKSTIIGRSIGPMRRLHLAAARLRYESSDSDSRASCPCSFSPARCRRDARARRPRHARVPPTVADRKNGHAPQGGFLIVGCVFGMLGVW